MQIESIFHQPYDQYAFPINNESYCLRLRTKKGDCASIKLFFGDPFDFNELGWKFDTQLNMSVAFSTVLFDYWEVKVIPPNKRMKYLFQIKNGQESIFYGECGIFNHFNPHDLSNCFTLPYLHRNEVITPPKWVENTVWYQIFPDRFANGNQLNNPADSLPWGLSSPTNSSFFGGDLEGIIHKIDYLKDLGITGLYLTPIFEANSNHKYDTINYFKIDPSFGNEKNLKKLIQKCHDNGIRVMLDAVFNHTSSAFPPFQDVLVNGRDSAFFKWFHFHPEGSDPTNWTYETFSFVKEMPKLNTENKEVQNFLLEIGTYWIKEFNIDGWRLDVANEIDHYFWKLFNNQMKNLKDDVFIVGEIWHHAMPWLRGDEFDSVMNYPLLKSILSYFGSQSISTHDFQLAINEIISLYPIQIIKVLFNILGTHDTPRILTQCNNNEKRVVLMYVFLFTFYGSPCIYYGDEIGLQGGNDPECRSCMLWEPGSHNQSIFIPIKKLISLRKLFPALENKGEFRWIKIDDVHNILIYERRNEDSTILIIINNSDNECTIPIPYSMGHKKITNIWNNEQFAADTDSVMINIKPIDFSILLIESSN